MKVCFLVEFVSACVSVCVHVRVCVFKPATPPEEPATGLLATLHLCVLLLSCLLVFCFEVLYVENVNVLHG